VGYLEPELYHPDSIGHPLAMTDCRVLAQSDIDRADSPDDMTEAPAGMPGELVMRGPQFMLGYWKEPQATAAVLRDGWFWSGLTRDREGFYRVVHRRKEMIKYKSFPVAPAEV
jgi:long-subunit acyl-CoA synthetase (AMP-forming)